MAEDIRIPQDLQVMSEPQVMAELERLTSIENQRTLTDAEFNRLLAVEKRLEQFTPPEELAAQEAAAARTFEPGFVDEVPGISDAELEAARRSGRLVELEEIGVKHREFNSMALLGGIAILSGLYYAIKKK